MFYNFFLRKFGTLNMIVTSYNKKKGSHIMSTPNIFNLGCVMRGFCNKRANYPDFSCKLTFSLFDVTFFLQGKGKKNERVFLNREELNFQRVG